MPDLIPVEDGIFDRHPEHVEIIRLRRTFAGMTKKVYSRLFTRSSKLLITVLGIENISNNPNRWKQPVITQNRFSFDERLLRFLNPER
jgi:hypothetical protein